MHTTVSPMRHGSGTISIPTAKTVAPGPKGPYNDHMMYSNTERKMEEVNFELQVAADEALEAEMFDRWVEEVAISFLSSEDIYDEMAA